MQSLLSASLARNSGIFALSAAFISGHPGIVREAVAEPAEISSEGAVITASVNISDAAQTQAKSLQQDIINAVPQIESLKLYGSAIRTSWGLPVYSGALYLEKAPADVKDFFNSAQQMELHITMLRDVTTEQLRSTTLNSFRANLSEKIYNHLKPKIDKFAEHCTGLNDGQKMIIVFCAGNSKGRVDLLRDGIPVCTFEDDKIFEFAVRKLWFKNSAQDRGLNVFGNAILAGEIREVYPADILRQELPQLAP